MLQRVGNLSNVVLIALVLAVLLWPKHQRPSASSSTTIATMSSAAQPSFCPDPGYPFNNRDHDQFKSLVPPTPTEAAKRMHERVLDAAFGPATQSPDLLVGEVVVTNPTLPQTNQRSLKVWLEWEHNRAITPLVMFLAEDQPANFLAELDWIRATDRKGQRSGPLAVVLPPGVGVHLVCLIPNGQPGQLMLITMLADRNGPTERALEYPLIMSIEREERARLKPAVRS